MDPVPGAEAVQVTHIEGSIWFNHFTWSPDGTQFAVVKGNFPTPYKDIYLVPYGGQSPVYLTGGSWSIRGIDWSPDGSRIAFACDRSGNYDIWVVVPVAGAEPIQLTHNPGFDIVPCWSPDGSRIAFASDRGGSWDIWCMSADGSNPVQLTNATEDETTPSWSPDGNRIAFSYWQNKSDIWILDME